MEGGGGTRFLRILDRYHLMTFNKSFNLCGAQGPHLQREITIQGYIYETFYRKSFDK